MTLDQHRQLIQTLLQGILPGTGGGNAIVIETHISSVILCAEVVYKFKKPLDLGFLDYSSLHKRQHFCHEELRRNRLMSPQLYLEVVAVYGAPDAPFLEPVGAALEYAVKMKPFAQQDQLDHLLERDELDAHMINHFATFIAEYHGCATVAATGQLFGDLDHVQKPVWHNFTQIGELVDDQHVAALLSGLEAWTREEFDYLAPHFEARREQGFIRECHGDLHLKNLAWSDDQPLAFDCIEFDPALYWIDVINDLAFLWMDLHYRQRSDLAWVLLNRYSEVSRDYASLRVLPFYAVYRALVRAKIAAISLDQTREHTQRELFKRQLIDHLELARTFTQRPARMVCLMHGASGSGKSYLAARLSPELNALVIRSDVVRKQLFEVDPSARQAHQINQGLYSTDATAKTYQRLRDLAADTLGAGYPVIIDASFVQREYRDLFRGLCDELQVPLVVLELRVEPDILRQRVTARKNDISDADITVLEHQLGHWRALDPDEARDSLPVDANQAVDVRQLSSRIQLMLGSA